MSVFEQSNSTLVLKFGGASVSAPEQFSHIADLIIQKKRNYQHIIVVVSAMGQTTNQLIDLACQVNPSPPQREYDMLISVGERISMSLLAMALCRKDCPAVSFTGSQSGIVTSSEHSNAQIIDVRPFRLIESLNEGKIVIVAGFQGVSVKKEITTLGRSGSDITAVALAIALNAHCVEFYKDVGGIFAQDPKLIPDAHHFPKLSYEEALQVVNQCGNVLHPRSIELAAKNKLPLHVRSFMFDKEQRGTWIGCPSHPRLKNPIYECNYE